LINYDTVLYLDTDILLLHNIDHLLEKKVTKKKIWMVADTQATADYKSIIIVKDRFNSGVIILRPAEDMCKECFQLLCDEGSDLFNKDLFLSDQYIFEKLYNQNKLDISCLELCYNVHPILVESITKYKLMKKIYILHYMVKPKPWTLYDLEVDHIFENTTCKDLFKLWLDLYNEMLETTYFKQNKTTNISGYKRGYYDNNKLVVYNKLITKLD
jgi:lipopolysaccharide biosynthesis glycosyltransferase